MLVAETKHVIYFPAYRTVLTSHSNVPRTGESLLRTLNSLIPFGDYVRLKPLIEVVTVVLHVSLRTGMPRGDPFSGLRIHRADEQTLSKVRAMYAGRCSGDRVVFRSFKATNNDQVDAIIKQFVSEEPYVDLLDCSVEVKLSELLKDKDPVRQVDA